MTDASTSLAERTSVQAVVTYATLAIFLASLVGALSLALLKADVGQFIAGVLGGVIGSSGTLAAISVNYWLGASRGGTVANAALAQLAGAGAPPPAEPKS